MSPSGHRITGATLGLAALWAAVGAPMGSTFPAVGMHALAGMAHPASLGESVTHAEAGVAFLVGALAGARAPDWLEVAVWTWSGQRMSAIPHRTLTHWLWAWLALLGGAVVYACLAHSSIRELAAIVVIGFTSTGLLHILLDAMTPSGVPLGNPFGPHKSLPLYRTGSAAEFLVIVLTGAAVFAIAWLFTRGAGVTADLTAHIAVVHSTACAAVTRLCGAA